jgi:MerR family transcriptional regulator, light-induced transcriptional regulator
MPRLHQESDSRVSAYLRAVLGKDKGTAEALVRKMIDDGASLPDVFDILGAAQVEVGNLWEKGVVTVSDEHYATEATIGCIAIAAERFKKFRRQAAGFAVLCPAEGEFHNVGLRMLSELLLEDGWNTDLLTSGSLISVFKELKALKKVDLFCISATMPSNVPRVVEAIRTIGREPSFASAKILVGGQAFGDAKAEQSLVARVVGAKPVDRIASNLREALEFSRSISSG